MNLQESKICLLYDTPYVTYDKSKLPPPPECYYAACKKGCNVYYDGERVYINGREFKNGKWRTTPKALLYFVLNKLIGR